MRRSIVSPPLGVVLVAAGIVILPCMVLLAWLFVSGLDRAERQLAAAVNSQDQLLLVTRIDAALRDGVAHGRSAQLAMVEELIASYRASIREEAVSNAAGIREDADAAQFGRLLQSIRRGEDPHAQAALTMLTTRVVRRERAELAAVAIDADRLRSEAQRTAIVLVLVLAMVLVGTGLLLYGMVMRPVRALGAGARAISSGGDGHVAVIGPAEFRLLARSFNGMVDRIAAYHGALEVEVRRRTAELRERTERLAAIDRSRRLFFSKVSHELRTPVAVMRGEAEVALRGRSPDPQTMADALGQVVVSADFLRRRLDDLLGLARSEEGQLTLERSPTDLTAIARSALEAAAPFARSSEVVLSGSNLTATVPMVGDAVWLRQALLAAIDNAVKFTGADGPVMLRLCRTRSEAALVLLDRGPGVPAGELERILDPYVQGAEGRARGGSGLGLSLARWVVEQHGGSVAARARRGGGLAIVMRLPAP